MQDWLIRELLGWFYGLADPFESHVTLPRPRTAHQAERVVPDNKRGCHHGQQAMWCIPADAQVAGKLHIRLGKVAQFVPDGISLVADYDES